MLLERSEKFVAQKMTRPPITKHMKGWRTRRHVSCIHPFRIVSLSQNQEPWLKQPLPHSSARGFSTKRNTGRDSMGLDKHLKVFEKWWKLWKRDSIWLEMNQGRLLWSSLFFGFSGSDGVRLEIMIDERSIYIYGITPNISSYGGSIVRYSTYPIKTCEVIRISILYGLKIQFSLNTWISMR